MLRSSLQVCNVILKLHRTEVGLSMSTNCSRSRSQRKLISCTGSSECAFPLLAEFDSITVARVSSWLKLDSPNADIRKGCETVCRTRSQPHLLSYNFHYAPI
jgi:hypothetical protein